MVTVVGAWEVEAVGFYTLNLWEQHIPYVPKKITIGLSASITSKVFNESK